MTRRLRYSVAATLDGFIADPDGGYDWIIMDESIDFAKMFEEFDTFVMGRKTWDVSAQTEFVQMFGTSEVIVFSRTLEAAPRPGVKVVKTSPADTVRDLKMRTTARTSGCSAAARCFERSSTKSSSIPSRWPSCRCSCRKACRCCLPAGASPE